MKDLALGQYVPGDSAVHRLDARAKLGLAFALTVAVFAVEGFAGLGVLAMAVVGAVALAQVPLSAVLRGLRPVVLVLAFTLVAHTLSGGPDAVRLGPLEVSGEGAMRGAYFAGRILLLVAGTSLLTLTTTPVRLTDALERLMRPLGRLRVPVGDLAMMLTITLRFIPTTAEEAEKVLTAQTARGARIGRGGPVKRVRSYLPVLVPLFVGLFRRADELSLAMEARCYRGGEGRTRLREQRAEPRDWAVLAIGCALLVVVGVLL